MTESIMERIRTQLTSAPINIEAVIRALGVSVKKGASLPEGISGQIKKLRDGTYEISSTQSEHDYRQRFSLAHELGHFVLHSDLIGQGLDDNTKYRSTEQGDYYNTAIELFHEKQANSFAASVLMPEHLIKQELENTADKKPLRDLYTKFQVSPSAMRWRLKNLGLLDQVTDE